MYGYRVRETTPTEGTGTIELDGAIGTGFRAFADEFASGAKVFYSIVSVNSDGDGDYEEGIGTLTHDTPDTLTRDTVLRSSNSNNKVNWGAGLKVVFGDVVPEYLPIDRTGESLASAATVTLANMAGNFAHITGTTTITSFGTATVAGQKKTVTFDGALTLTHGSNLVLPGAANITTAAGDVATFRADTTTKWVCEGYAKASGTAVVGRTLATKQATTSGSSKTFSGIPSWVKRITIMFNGVSTDNAAANFLVQLGDSGGIETSGYSGAATSLVSGTTTVNNLSSSFLVLGGNAATTMHGNLVLTLLDAATNTWSCSGNLARSDTVLHALVAGTKALSATLTQIQISPSAGNFDAGEINIMYE